MAAVAAAAVVVPAWLNFFYFCPTSTVLLSHSWFEHNCGATSTVGGEGAVVPSYTAKMLKFHPYSILTGDTMVEFVMSCALRLKQDKVLEQISKSFYTLVALRLL